jgi:AcrR family transcriptional regulator
MPTPVRTRILDAAMAVLAQDGVQALTQPRICKAAGVRQSHLTYYFPTIADLLQALAGHVVAAIDAEFARHGGEGARASLLETIAAATADKRRVRVMMGLVAAADRDAKLKPQLRAFIRTLRAGVAAILRRGGLAGSPDEVAFLHAVVIGCAVLQLARDNAEARREARAVVARAVLALRGAL